MYVYIYTYEVYTKGGVNRRRGDEYIKKEERREHVWKPVATPDNPIG